MDFLGRTYSCHLVFMVSVSKCVLRLQTRKGYILYNIMCWFIAPYSTVLSFDSPSNTRCFKSLVRIDSKYGFFSSFVLYIYHLKVYHYAFTNYLHYLEGRFKHYLEGRQNMLHNQKINRNVTGHNNACLKIRAICSCNISIYFTIIPAFVGNA